MVKSFWTVGDKRSFCLNRATVTSIVIYNHSYLHSMLNHRSHIVLLQCIKADWTDYFQRTFENIPVRRRILRPRHICDIYDLFAPFIHLLTYMLNAVHSRLVLTLALWACILAVYYILKYIEAFEMWCYRRLLRIPWMQHIMNEWILCKLKVERELLDCVKSLKLEFYGHTTWKYESLEKEIVQGCVPG